MTYNAELEFNKTYTVHDILTMNSFIPSTSAVHITQLGYHSEYISESYLNVIIKIESPIHTGGPPLISIFNKHGLELVMILHGAYDCYYHYNCNQDENRAENWKSEMNRFPVQNYNSPEIQSYSTPTQQYQQPVQYPQNYPPQQPYPVQNQPQSNTLSLNLI